MNPLLCASLTFLLTVSQAVAVVAKGKKSASKPKSKKPIPLIIAVVVAVVVGKHMPCHPHSIAFSRICPVSSPSHHWPHRFYYLEAFAQGKDGEYLLPTPGRAALHQRRARCGP